MELQAHVTCTHESACAIGILECSITLFRKSKHHVGVTKTHSAIKLDTNPKHVHTCITTHAVWQVSCGSVCETHDIVWWHMSSHVSCGTYCDPGAPWLIRHCADVSPRQLQVIAIWRSRDFKIEIPRLQDLEIATSEIVKCVDCEYCGV